MAFKVFAVGSWYVTPCGLVGGYQHFEGTNYFHLQVDIPGWANRNARRILEHCFLKDNKTRAVPCEVAAWPLTLRGGADKSLARLTSRCRRTESIVSLERGVCS